MIFFNDNHFTLEKYLSMQEYLFYPLFNMPLFYKSLKQKIVPGKCPSFAAERKKTKDLLSVDSSTLTGAHQDGEASESGADSIISSSMQYLVFG